MTIQKWNEKVSAILDKTIDKCAQDDAIMAYCNIDEGPLCNGVLFCDSSKENVRCLFCAGSTLLSACNEQQKHISEVLKREFDRDATLADSIEYGQSVDRWGKVTKIRKFSAGDRAAYVNEKLLKVFPKNSLFYVSGSYCAVHVAMEEKGRFYDLGLVMPMRCANFEKIEKEA